MKYFLANEVNFNYCQREVTCNKFDNKMLTNKMASLPQLKLLGKPICVLRVSIEPVYDFSSVLWNCPDSEVCFVFHFMRKEVLKLEMWELISSPDPKVHVSYCHHLAYVVVVRRKLFQKSSPQKLLNQLKPNLVWIITSLKIVSGDAVHQPTWPLLLNIEHMVKLQVFG